MSVPSLSSANLADIYRRYEEIVQTVHAKRETWTLYTVRRSSAITVRPLSSSSDVAGR